MQRVAAADPSIAALPSVTKALADAGKPAANADAGGDDKGGDNGDDAAAAAASGDDKGGDKGDDAAKPGDGAADDDDADLEIKPEDDTAKQLEKLRKAQKKTLKRLDGEVAKRKDLETKLATHEKPADDEPAQGDALGTVKTLEELQASAQQIDGYLKFLAENAAKGTTIKDASGKDVELSPEDVVQEILFWTDVKAIQVPAKRAFIETRAKAQTEAANKFKPWQDKASFTTVKAEVEQGMKGAKALLADYDLAVHERTLGRMAVSGEFDLVPKRKAAVAGVESAPGKAKPPATPVNPPSSGGPPIKPAGTGPDLEQLKQNMLKNPGNQTAVQAYIKAKLSAGQQAA